MYKRQILPKGCDELGVAGALQGYPVELVKAKTVDALAIANSEYVIEGYLDTTQKVWESPLAEAEQKQGVYPFHPEWPGYMGKAYRTYKFQATAITHRREKPIYNGMIVHGMDDHFIDTTMREACFLEIADRICPGLCIDTHIPMGMWVSMQRPGTMRSASSRKQASRMRPSMKCSSMPCTMSP